MSVCGVRAFYQFQFRMLTCQAKRLDDGLAQPLLFGKKSAPTTRKKAHQEHHLEEESGAVFCRILSSTSKQKFAVEMSSRRKYLVNLFSSRESVSPVGIMSSQSSFEASSKARG